MTRAEAIADISKADGLDEDAATTEYERRERRAKGGVRNGW